MGNIDEANAFLNGQGAKAFPFDHVGASVTGVITDLDVRQQTDMQTGEVQYWADGRPKQILVITIQTELQDDEADDGLRTLWIRGGNFMIASGKGSSALTAVKDALRKAGAKDLEIGATITMTHSGMGKASNKGFSPPKLYTADYQPAVRNVSVDELS